MGRAAKIKTDAKPVEPMKLDFGSGPHPREGFEGVDKTEFVGVKHVVDLVARYKPPHDPGRIPIYTLAEQAELRHQPFKPWPWADNSVAEAHASHFVEHLTGWERVHFCNELYRVLVPQGMCQIIVPHWASCRAYGDPTHQWPPVSEFWFYYLSKNWRAGNAPHCDISWNPEGFNCDFEATWGYALRQDLLTRNQEFQQFAIGNYKEAVMDTIANLKCLK